MSLYRIVENPPEGTPLQYLGVYILNWLPEYGRPAVGFVEVEEELKTTERIAKVQSDLFQIREDLRDQLDDNKDARFVRLAAEIGALAEEFLPEDDK